MNINKLEDIIRKVEGLIAKADHANTGKPEADAFRQKAEALMFKYRIEEIQLDTSGNHAPSDPLPQWATIVICDYDSEFIWAYRTLFGLVARHFDIRHESVVTHGEDGSATVTAEAVGYESDLRFVRVLWSSIRLAFQGKLEPKVDGTLSEEENAYRLRAAGMEGTRMALLLYGDMSKGNRVKARSKAKKYAASIGEDPKVFSGQGNSMKVYRDSYSQGFQETIGGRFMTMRNNREPGQAGELVLASRKDRIEDAFYERYPNRKPRTPVQTAAGSTYKTQAQCAKCAKAKSGYCREHGWMRPRASKARMANMGALRAGQSAARTVDFGYTNREVK